MMVYQLTLLLAQYTPPWEDPVPAGGAGGGTVPAHGHEAPIDLSKGFQQVYGGTVSENTFRNGMLVVIAIVMIVALVAHYRQRRVQPKALDSQSRLGWELCRMVPFPFGSRLMLWWVARSTRTPIATLLISDQAFEAAVLKWGQEPTFSPLRQWGRSRLRQLQPILFG
ncbi:MAG: hypothetical protein WCI73_07850 [Phycisphaerae bacterium]